MHRRTPKMIPLPLRRCARDRRPRRKRSLTWHAPGQIPDVTDIILPKGRVELKIGAAVRWHNRKPESAQGRSVQTDYGAHRRHRELGHLTAIEALRSSDRKGKIFRPVDGTNLQPFQESRRSISERGLTQPSRSAGTAERDDGSFEFEADRAADATRL